MWGLSRLKGRMNLLKEIESTCIQQCQDAHDPRKGPQTPSNAFPDKTLGENGQFLVLKGSYPFAFDASQGMEQGAMAKI